MSQIEIKLEDGKTRSLHSQISLEEILKETFPNKQDVIVAKVNNKLCDLSQNVVEDAEVQFLTPNDPEGMQVFWHSTSHIMAQAVKALYKNVALAIGPSIANGFYYDFKLEESLSVDELERIESKMDEIVQLDQPFIRETLLKEEAISLFKSMGEIYKLELIQDIPDDEVTIYKNGDFLDLCRGPHVPSTKYIKNFKLLSVAGAYWRGDERNDVLQRIYGISFPNKKDLKKHLTMLEEAKKRDHRRLAKELDLFSFQAEGPGFPFWHANGMVLHNEVSSYMRNLLTEKGYQEIKTPLIMNEALWHQSGHWDNYKENMYFTQIDEQDYAVKPMNCPGALLVYKNSPHSYKELPIKMSEMGLVHRHEKSGVLHGLFRVRMFTQDDAHVFCMPDQMEDEVIKLIDLIDEVYHTFGFDNFTMELSTRPAKSIGSAEMWERAENALKNALATKGIQYQVNPGDGAFYGPKIDYHIQDSLGRTWQCGTIQLDFSMPERFELEYVGTDGIKHRPVMIHRAIFGSVERFIGILIEHYGGAFPVWLSPVQTTVIPVSERHLEYAEKVTAELKAAGIRVKLDSRNEKVGFKIREAATQKVPYMCIVGDAEIEDNTVAVRKRGEGDIGKMSLELFKNKIQDEIIRRISH